MSDDAPVTHQRTNAARHSAPRHRDDTSGVRAQVARERPVVAIARTDDHTRRCLGTARSDDVRSQRRALPSFGYDFRDDVCEVLPINDVLRNRLWVVNERSGHAAARVREQKSSSEWSLLL
jgi:hypothetical protein